MHWCLNFNMAASRCFRRAFFAWNRKSIICLKCQANKRYLTRSSSSVFEPPNLADLVGEAGKVVGYPTSLLRCLLSDEISSVLVNSKKLVGSRHPLVKTAKQLVYDGNEGLEAIGLIVLLISRAAEPLMRKILAAPLGQDSVSGVYRNQRKLAEVAEMIKTGYMVHLGVVNKENFHSSENINVMNFGNKISVLTGDFFLAKASVGLSELDNTRVVDIMAGVIGDIVEGELWKDYASMDDLAWKDWEDITFKCRGSLIAKSCLATLKLCSLPQMHQDAGFSYGKYLAFLQQLQQDNQAVSSPDAQSISITNAAVILTKETLSKNLADNNRNSTTIVMDESTRLVIKNSETGNKIQNLCNNYGQLALESLEDFPSSEAKTCLENLIKHLMVLRSIG